MRIPTSRAALVLAVFLTVALAAPALAGSSRMISPLDGCVTLLSPNGGENWTAGQSYNIAFDLSQCAGANSIDVAYREAPGESWKQIMESAQMASPYAWKIPIMESTHQAQVIIGAWALDQKLAEDMSDSAFTIYNPPPAPCTPAVVSPNGGENWTSGTVEQIVFDVSGCTGTQGVLLQFQRMPVGDWLNIGDTSVLNQPFEWKVPDGPSTHDARVRVQAFREANLLGEDASDNVFTIWNGKAACTVRVAAPNGGENWSSGSTENIHWDVSASCGATTLDLYYRESPQESWKWIKEMAYNLGPYAWTIPAIQTTDDAQVRIEVWSGGPMVGDDASDNVFTIWNGGGGGGGGGCAATLTSPVHGDNVSANSVHRVTWTYAGCADAVGARIWWTPDSIHWSPVADNLPKGGPYDWSVPNIPTTDDAQMQVSLFDANGKTIVEAGSGGTFLVWNGPLPPCDLVVDSPAKGDNWSAKSQQTISWTITGCASATGIDVEWGIGDNGPWHLIRESRDILVPVPWTVADVATTDDGFVRVTLWSSGVILEKSYGGNFLIWNGLAPGLGGVSFDSPVIAVKIGEAVPLKATALDPDGKPITNAALSFSLAGDVGTIDAENNLLAMSKGAGVVSATAMVGGATKTSEARVIAYLLTHSLSGQVLADGKPVAGATLTAILTDPQFGEVEMETVKSAADGSYSFALIESQDYKLKATAQGYEDTVTTSRVAEQDSTMDIQLKTRGFVLPAFPWWSYAIVAVGMIGSIAAILTFLATTEAGLMMVGAAAFVLLSRIKRESVLDHFLRGQIYGCILSSPGITYNRIKRRVGASNGTLAYHLHTLEREAFVKSVPNGQYRQFYPVDARPMKSNEMLLSRLQESILGLVRTKPGIVQAEITSQLQAKRQSVSYNVRRLRDMGLIKIAGWGKLRRCFPAEPPTVGFGVGPAV